MTITNRKAFHRMPNMLMSVFLPELLAICAMSFIVRSNYPRLQVNATDPFGSEKQYLPSNREDSIGDAPYSILIIAVADLITNLQSGGFQFGSPITLVVEKRLFQIFERQNGSHSGWHGPYQISA